MLKLYWVIIMIQLTKKERSVMDILWDSPIEMSASDIRETSNEELSIYTI